MARVKTRFFCRECGQESARWLGRCPGCGEWNTFVEERVENVLPTIRKKGAATATPLSKIETVKQERLDTGSPELNRVLGGGVVPGAFILLSGEPGIGKSTLLLQMADFMARQTAVLYVSGEESASQIKLRADRLGISSERLHILTETSLEKVADEVLNNNYGMVFVDSIQTMMLEELQSAPGSVSQVREGAAFLMRLAKENEIAVFLVGHVTKDGAIAGPRVLEHMVDTVLYFEGDHHHIFRLLRAVKNRFGPANEIGVFEMRGNGLAEVANPSLVFMGERASSAVGSAVAVTMEGTRPLLVEIQALVTPTVYNPPRRTANGMDYHRLLMLLAVLDKRARHCFVSRDVFVNIAGGLYVNDPAVDLAVISALLSALQDKVLPRLAMIGELGLTGEIRGVSQVAQRVKEAEKFGFEGCIIPEVNLNRLESTGFKVYPVRCIEDLLQQLFK